MGVELAREGGGEGEEGRKGTSLVDLIAQVRGECKWEYLNGAALVHYGFPVFFK